MPEPSPSTASIRDLSVVGVGSLAEAIVVGLSDGWSDAPMIVLSPRGRERSARLAERFPNVRVAADNQSAVDAAGTVLLCVRPHDAEEVVGALTFRADQRVVSVMARHTVAGLQQLVAPATDVVRTLPNPSVARRQGFTPVFPGGTPVDDLLDVLGGAMVLDEERLLDAAAAASSTVAAHFAYLRTTSRWLADHGVAEDVASRYISSIFAGVGAELAGATDLEPLAVSHATPGGTNERVERTLRAAGVFDEVVAALDELHDSF